MAICLLSARLGHVTGAASISRGTEGREQELIFNKAVTGAKIDGMRGVQTRKGFVVSK